MQYLRIASYPIDFPDIYCQTVLAGSAKSVEAGSFSGGQLSLSLPGLHYQYRSASNFACRRCDAGPDPLLLNNADSHDP